MSEFKNLIKNILIESILFESEAKIDFLLQNKKLEDAIKTAIQNDPEIENKEISPKDLLMKWDDDLIVNKYIQWITKQYSQGLFHVGDLYRVKNDLQKFEKYRKNKDVFDSSDINK